MQQRNYIKQTLIQGTLIIGFMPFIANGAVIMDSVAEFSNTQGQNDWSYGYYNGDLNAYTPGDFELMTQFSASTWSVQTGTGGFWTSLTAAGGHPNGLTTSGGRQSIDHWAVRRWTSDSIGTLTLDGNLSKSNFSGGTGIIGHIFVDGLEVFSQGITGTDGLGVNYSFDINIGIGSIVDFAIDPNLSMIILMALILLW